MPVPAPGADPCPWLPSNSNLLTGTPAFFINGRVLTGAQPFEKFKEVIDEELARSTSAKAP